MNIGPPYNFSAYDPVSLFCYLRADQTPLDLIFPEEDERGNVLALAMVVDVPGVYATQDGRLWSLRKAEFRGGRFDHGWLKPTTYTPNRANPRRLPYQKVGIMGAGKLKFFMVHRLVLLAWEGRPPMDRPHAMHLDGDPANNRLENLRWGNPITNNRCPQRLARERATRRRKYGR